MAQRESPKARPERGRQSRKTRPAAPAEPSLESAPAGSPLGSRDLGGRPRIDGPAVSHIEAIKTMAGYGLTQAMMATILGWSDDTFTRRKQDDPQVARALEEGRATAAYNVGEALYTKAVGVRIKTKVRGPDGEKETVVYTRPPETAAIRWFEISRLGMKDRVVVEGDRENPIIGEVADLTTAQKVDQLISLVGRYGGANGRQNANGRKARRTE